ncbi:integrase catalytic domain-containing protein [Trichonephila inaurata madagascariensis]|uniref:Integrase catalytic domain-containing protein n=1 Tax=Trichonephila inaurata madagascariensis TaxID=2747483 RepID=A0A8X7BPG4_9ARAC|nr:integrase catalytic domain-containing protein [Trichonephila inaurata madagascariensis]
MWRHIPGTLNAADLVSRGCSGEHLIQGKWWEGPTWLLENEENWPKSEDEPDEDLVNSEKSKTIVTLTKTDENVNWYWIRPILCGDLSSRMRPGYTTIRQKWTSVQAVDESRCFSAKESEVDRICRGGRGQHVLGGERDPITLKKTKQL